MNFHRQLAAGMRVSTENPLTLTVTTPSSAHTFTIKCQDAGVFNAAIDWGDGEYSTITAYNDASLAHVFAVAGQYDIVITGDFPNFYFNNSGDEDLISAVAGGVGQPQVSANNSFYGAVNLTSYSEHIDLSGCTDFISAWRSCSSLTSFPLVDLSSGTNFSAAWRSCSSLTSFPLVDLSSGTNFSIAWNSCSSLTSFPLVDLSSGTDFSAAWSSCSSLTSFPLVDLSSGTRFGSAWSSCSSLTSFPSEVFDSWAGVPIANCFYQAWASCISLTATSVENILNSIAASGVNAPSGAGTEVEITIDFNVSSGTPDISSAVATLTSNGWGVRLNGVLQ